MKQTQKTCLVGLLMAGVICFFIAPFSAVHSKWVESAGLIFDIAGVVQLEISGLFEHYLEKYGDVGKYPYGPPSHITRQIIDNPDTPIRTWIRNTAFFEKRTGFWLLVIGFFFRLRPIGSKCAYWTSVDSNNPHRQLTVDLGHRNDRNRSKNCSCLPASWGTDTR